MVKFRAICYDAQTGNKKWAGWRDTWTEAYEDLENIKDEFKDTGTNYTIERDDNILPDKLPREFATVYKYVTAYYHKAAKAYRVTSLIPEQKNYFAGATDVDVVIQFPTNSQQEEQYYLKQLKDFFGIQPKGDDIDTYLSKLTKQELTDWKNYWTEIFKTKNSALNFVNKKYNEYYPKAPETKPKPKEPKNKIYGTVIDKTLRTPIPLATITFGGKTAVTGNDGKYEIKNVWHSGEISASAQGYKQSSKIIEAPQEGELEVNFELEREEIEITQPTPIQPIVEDRAILATALRNVGLDDWADKYNEIYDWLVENYGVPVGDDKKVIVLQGGLTTGLTSLASRLGLSTVRGALSRAASAIAGAVGGLSASSIIKGAMGIAGTVIFAEFICEEAVQMSGIGVYQAMQTKDTEVIKQAIENYRNVLNAAKTIHEHVKYLDPIGTSFDAFFTAAEDNLTNYEKLLQHLEEKDKRKELSKTTVLNLYREQLIDEEKAKEYLKKLNYSDEDVELMLTLEAKKLLANVKITSKPARASIFINDEPTDLLTPETLKLPPGRYKITLKLDDYYDEIREITLEPQDKAE